MLLPQRPGIAQWFRVGEREHVEKTAEIVNDLKIEDFRIPFSLADWETPEGPAWFDYVVTALTEKTKVRLIPVLFSPSPTDLDKYARFTEEIIKRYGAHFDWVQIWNEPNNTSFWNCDLDPNAELFARMASEAVDVAHALGKKAALGGLSPYEPEWLTLVYEHGLLSKCDAVGINYSPSSTEGRRFFGWDIVIKTARAHLKGLGLSPEIWIAEAGLGTEAGSRAERHDVYQQQIEFFETMQKTSADKIFWRSVFDGSGDFGILTHNMRKKPLYFHWKSLK